MFSIFAGMGAITSNGAGLGEQRCRTTKKSNHIYYRLYFNAVGYGPVKNATTSNRRKPVFGIGICNNKYSNTLVYSQYVVWGLLPFRLKITNM
jgi:hypothetical protein